MAFQNLSDEALVDLFEAKAMALHGLHDDEIKKRVQINDLLDRIKEELLARLGRSSQTTPEVTE